MALLTRRQHGDRPREAATAREAPRRQRARKRRWWLLIWLLMLATVIWLLPAIVAHTPLLSWILAKATAGLGGTVTIGSASLGWLSPIVVEQIEVCDPQGEPVLQAAQLTGSRSLGAILWNRSRLGRFRLEQPRLSVRLRDDGSNVEDLLANYLAGSEETLTRVGLTIEVTDGRVSVTDQGSARTWQIEGLRLWLSVSADTSGPLKLQTSAAVSDPQRPGRLAVGLTLRTGAAEDRPRSSEGELAIESEQVPLAMFRSLLGRLLPQARLSGRLGCEIHARWGGDEAGGKMALQADAAANDLTLSAPPLGADRLQLGHLHAACRISQQGDSLEIKQSSVDCDLGTASLRGTLALGNRPSGKEAPWGASEWAGWLLSSLLRGTHEINGRVDLARLAQMLPTTLRIRKGTRITSGQMQLALSSHRGSSGMFWRGRIEVGDLTATYHGRQLAWQRPILVTLAAREGRQGPVVESLECESDFLKLHAAGTPDELSASASFDVKELARQLDQFVDLGETALAGDGWGHVKWTRSEKQKFEADAELQVRDLHVSLPQRQPWVEENLLVFLSARGRTDLGTDTQLHAASLNVRTSAEQIEAKLARPVLDFRGGGTWPVDLHATGQLQSWPARLSTWISLDHWSLAGPYELGARATVSTDRVSVPRARLAVKQLQLQSPWLNVHEPHVELSLSGRWDRSTRRVQFEPVRLTSERLSIQSDRLVLAIPEQGTPEITGAVRYQGDLGRLHQWIGREDAPPKRRVAGRLTGMAVLSPSAGVTGAEIEAEVANLAVVFPSGQRFHEPLIRLAARGSYEHRAKTLRLEHVELAAGSLGARGSGRIGQTGEQTEIQLAGQLQYDLQRLAELLRPYVGPGVRIVGRGTSPASYQGSLALAGARAEASARWQWANLYGFQVGPGELKATLADGILRAEPLQLAVRGGRLLVAPRVRLAAGPTELSLPPGPLVQRVQVTPAMCASALQYIAPVLAGVTTAQGSFSIELHGCRIPLDAPARGELAGRFTIHSIQVGPGPLVRELAVLLGRAAPAKLRRESIVPFRMVDGRVYHRGLELIFPEVTIRTYGSVGLDQTLAVMAEMPVPPKWLGNNVLGSALSNQTIRLPIGGTLSQPKVDRRQLDRVSRQLLGGAARNVIEDELNKQLDELDKQLQRLFNPRR